MLKGTLEMPHLSVLSGYLWQQVLKAFSSHQAKYAKKHKNVAFEIHISVSWFFLQILGISLLVFRKDYYRSLLESYKTCYTNSFQFSLLLELWIESYYSFKKKAKLSCGLLERISSFPLPHNTVCWEQSSSRKINVSSFVASVMQLLHAQWHRGAWWDGGALD